MTDGEDSGTQRRRPIGADLIIPVAAIVFTLYYFSTIIDSPWTAQVSAFFIGAILLVLCVAFLTRATISVTRSQANLSLEKLATRQDLYSGRLALFVLTVLYTVVIQWGGFTLTTFLFLLLAMLVLNKGRKKLLVAATSAMMAFGGWALFIFAFDTRFPRGPFEDLMRWLLS